MNTISKLVSSWVCEDEDFSETILDKIDPQTASAEDVAGYVKEIIDDLLEDETFVNDTFKDILQEALNEVDYNGVAEEFLDSLAVEE